MLSVVGYSVRRWWIPTHIQMPLQKWKLVKLHYLLVCDCCVCSYKVTAWTGSLRKLITDDYAWKSHGSGSGSGSFMQLLATGSLMYWCSNENHDLLLRRCRQVFEAKLLCICQTTWHHLQNSHIVVSAVRSFYLTRIVICVHLVFSFYMYMLWMWRLNVTVFSFGIFVITTVTKFHISQ